MFCPQCANKIPLQNQKFCNSCGFDLSKVVEENPSQTNEKHAAAVQQSVSVSPKKAGVKKKKSSCIAAANTEGRTMDDPTDWFDSASKKWKLQDYAAAWADVNMAISLKPDYAEAYCGRAKLKSFLEDHQGALADVNTAISLKPDYANAYCTRGIVYLWLAQKSKALADLTRAIELGYPVPQDILDMCK